MQRFKPIVGYEDSYAINREGEVISLSRTIKLNHGQIGRVHQCRMHARANGNGELVVQLCKNSQRCIHTTKSLIEGAFGGNS
jgi:hypothetical protein